MNIYTHIHTFSR